MSTLNSEKIAQLAMLSVLKSTLLLIVAGLAMRLLSRASASVRHLVCSMALTCAIVIPVLALAIPAWRVSLPQATNTVENLAAKSVFFIPPRLSDDDATAASVPNNPDSAVSLPPTHVNLDDPAKATTSNLSQTRPYDLPQPSSIDLYSLFLLVWCIGAALLLARWLIQAERVRRITRRGELIQDSTWSILSDELQQRLNIRRRVVLVLSDEVLVPMTFGLLRPTIILPCAVEGWSPERRRIVLTHELIHIARWDYLTQWIGLLSCAVNWFNPLVWKMARTLTVERERACDDQVLALGTRSSEYAANLIDIAQTIQHRQKRMGALALVESSDLAKRIRRILDREQSRRTFTRRRSFGLMLILAVALLPLSSIQLSRASQNAPIVLSIAVQQGMSDALQETVIRDFEAAHPGVAVAVVDAMRIPDAGDGLDPHLTAWQKYANSADLLFFDSYSLALTPHATRAGLMLDLTPLITSDASLNMDDFYPQLVSSFKWDNGVWALPMGADMIVLDYNKTAFDRAGLIYPDGSWTLNDFINAVTKLTTKDLDGHVIASGFANSGRIFRESLWRSLIGANLVDDSVIPNAPHFDTLQIAAVVDAYYQLEQQGLIGGDVSSAAMFVDTAGKGPPPDHGYSLLPGGKSVLLPYGFGISAGTQHPDLAYDLLKLISARPELSGGLKARKSIAGGTGGISGRVPPALQSLAEKAFANSLNYADLRFADYLNSAWITHPTTIKEAIQVTEVRAVNDVKAASDKKGTLALQVSEPTVATLPAGKIALNFDIATFQQPLPTRDLWDKLITEFTANDPQVGMVNLRVVSEPMSMAASHSDCFYLPTNAVPTLNGNLVLNLDPFLTTDPSFDKNDYAGSVLAAVQRDNKTYALPVGIEPLVLRYNVARLKAANLPEPANNWTVEAFVDALRALKPGSEGQPPMVDAGSSGTYLLVLMAAYGGIPIDYRTDPPTLHFTDPATIAAIRQVLDLTKNSLIKYSALGNLSGGLDASPGPTTAIYPINLNDFALKKAPGSAPDKPILFPMGHQVNGLAYNLGTTYISAQSANPDACYRFIKAIANHPELTSAMPVRHSILSNATFKATVNPEVLALYNQADALLNNAQTIPFPLANRGSIAVSSMLVQHWLFEAFDAYALNSGDLNAALRDAESYAKGFLECAATLPALNTDEAGKNQLGESVKAYVDCAEHADSRLKSVLDPLVGR